MDERFLRNEMLWGKDGQARLTAAHVIVFGLGGVGSYVTECLARAGVGELTLVDSDTVALSNLNRQLEALDSTVGLPKAEAVARRVRDINPYAVLHPMEALYNADNREQFFPAGCRYDYIVDAIDTVSTKLAISKLAQERSLPLISSMGGANKLHPECLRIADVHKTVNDSLSRIMRKECRKRGIRHLKVLYSCEDPMHLKAREGAARSERSDLGTASFMPPIMGQMIAGEVIRQISGVGTQSDTAAALAMHDAAQRGALAGRKGPSSKKKS